MPVTTPLVVTVESVRDCLAGEQIADYLSSLGTTDDVDEKIKKQIVYAQSYVEREAQTHLTQRKIKCRPLEPYQADGVTPNVQGVDYDYLEEAYTWFPDDWRNGFAQVVLKRRPVQSIERVVVRYGQVNPQTVLLLPEQWIVANHKMGIVHILPLVGIGSASATGLVVLPILGQGINKHGTIPAILSVDYTAGYLPADYDPDEDAFNANPDQDVRGLLEAVTYMAATRMLNRVQIIGDARAGSISMNGASESYSPGQLKTIVDTLKMEARELIDSYLFDSNADVVSVI